MRLVGGTALALQYGHRRSVDFFEDADAQPMPYMFADVGWEAMKGLIRSEVERYNRQHT